MQLTLILTVLLAVFSTIKCYGGGYCRLDVSGCDQICTANTFTCSCVTGYQLAANGFSCNDINECTTNNGGCSEACINTMGSFRCGCSNPGYAADSTGTCVDVDECARGTDNCEQTCVNTDGSFNCDCVEGFTLDGDDVSCSDVNECQTNNGGCSEVCQNNVGSFECACNNPGYQVNATGTCVDFDECATQADNCDQVCTNTDGAFTCSCDPGYTLDVDGSTCNDNDECATQNGGCQQVCNNEPGSFSCACNSGYSLNADAVTCENINECLSSPCQYTCTDTDGSFECSCDQGFALADDRTSCNEVDECMLNVDNCQQQCVNTVGSFQCACDAGFTLSSDGFTCYQAEDRQCSISGSAGLTTFAGETGPSVQLPCTYRIADITCDNYQVLVTGTSSLVQQPNQPFSFPLSAIRVEITQGLREWGGFITMANVRALDGRGSLQANSGVLNGAVSYDDVTKTVTVGAENGVLRVEYTAQGEVTVRCSRLQSSTAYPQSLCGSSANDANVLPTRDSQLGFGVISRALMFDILSNTGLPQNAECAVPAARLQTCVSDRQGVTNPGVEALRTCAPILDDLRLAGCGIRASTELFDLCLQAMCSRRLSAINALNWCAMRQAGQTATRVIRRRLQSCYSNQAWAWTLGTSAMTNMLT